MLKNCTISGFADEIDVDLQKQIALLNELGVKQVEFRSANGKGVADYTEEEAQKAMDTARSLFGGGADAADMPSTVLDPALVGETGIGILDLLTAAGLVPSKGEGRRLIQQGGIALEGEKVTDPMSVVSRDRLEQGVVVKKGKKVYHKVSL